MRASFMLGVLLVGTACWRKPEPTRPKLWELVDARVSPYDGRSTENCLWYRHPEVLKDTDDFPGQMHLLSPPLEMYGSREVTMWEVTEKKELKICNLILVEKP